MSQYRRILLFADPSMQRTPAFERAAWLARTTGAALHISLSDYDEAIAKLLRTQAASGARAQTSFLLQRRDWLAQESAALKAEGISVTVQAAWAHPLKDEMLAQITEYAPDLVVKDALHEPLLRRLLLTPLDWHLLRECEAPLMMVGRLNHVVPRCVVAAVDVAQDRAGINDKIIRHALALSIQCDAELHLAYVFQILPTVSSADITGDLTQVMLQAEQDNFEALAAAHGVPTDRAHFRLGQPAAALADLALEMSADVIVIGSIQHSRIDRMLLGSTAEALLDRAPCDLLAVKPD